MFKTALSITDAPNQSLPIKDPVFVRETKNCGMYLQEKLFEEQRMQQVTNVKKTVISSSNAGGSIPKGS